MAPFLGSQVVYLVGVSQCELYHGSTQYFVVGQEMPHVFKWHVK